MRLSNQKCLSKVYWFIYGVLVPFIGLIFGGNAHVVLEDGRVEHAT
jgi:hypothetical protein